MFTVYIFVIVLMALGVYAVAMKDNIIKKIIGLSIIGHAVHILIINIGNRESRIMPIITSENLVSFSWLSVDPLPQALVLTSIVIDFGISVLALSLAVMIYKHNNSLSAKSMRRMKG